MRTIKAKANKIQKLSEITLGSLKYKIAKANIDVKGYYTYTDSSTKEKVFVEA